MSNTIIKLNKIYGWIKRDTVDGPSDSKVNSTMTIYDLRTYKPQLKLKLKKG